MTTKQISGLSTPDGGSYGTLTDGSGNLTPTTTSSSGTQQIRGRQAPDGSRYMTLTDGAGNLT